jgi:hypothetical protein
MSYEDNLKKQHKERLYIAIALVVLVGVVALVDKFFNLGILE